MSFSTIHGAKGQEWKVVFVVGATDGLIPSYLAAGPQVAEERRLLYVAVTRARERLYLLHAPFRIPRPFQEDLVLTSPSPFLSKAMRTSRLRSVGATE